LIRMTLTDTRWAIIAPYCLGRECDRHAFPGTRGREVDRGQDRDHRGGQGLMATGLDGIDFWSDVVGVVDHPVRQPKQALFHGLEIGHVE
jgi:hypothetical protein